MIEEILRIMPRFIAEEIVHLNLNNSITEIRIRSKNKIIVICSKNEFVLDLIASPKIILDILLNVSKMSIYAIQTDIWLCRQRYATDNYKWNISKHINCVSTWLWQNNITKRYYTAN